MDRISKSQVQKRFDYVMEKLGLKTHGEVRHRRKEGQSFYKEGFVHLSYNPYYGGYNVDVIHAETYQSEFRSMRRLSAREMMTYLDALDLACPKKVCKRINGRFSRGRCYID